MKAIRFASVLILFGLAFPGCEEEAESPWTSQPVPVRTMDVRMKDSPIVVYASGTLASREQMLLSFKIDGIIERLAVQEGDRVKKGARLAVLNQTEIQARVNQARATLERVEQDFLADRKLYADSVITHERFMGTKNAWAHARADLEIAQYNLKFSSIDAPVDGRIQKKLGEANELIQAGHPLFIFQSSEDALVLRVGLADRDILHLSPGDSASVRFDAYPGRPFAAVVSELPASATPQSGLYEVELTLLPRPDPLLPGMMGRAEIHTQRSRRQPAIPIEALMDADSDRGYVYVLDGDIVHKRPVSLGLITASEVLVVQGLSAGETIVIDGAPYLRDRSQVIISSINASPAQTP